MSWLYALSMVWHVDVPLLTLTDVVAKASFKLSNLITGEKPPGEYPPGPTADSGAPMVLDWETEVLAMPPELD